MLQKVLVLLFHIFGWIPSQNQHFVSSGGDPDIQLRLEQRKEAGSHFILLRKGNYLHGLESFWKLARGLDLCS
jgi:hypothetical protein